MYIVSDFSFRRDLSILKTPNFSKQLLKWYSKNARSHPWKKIKNPYFIWLSEIILQQTRVEAGTPYYLKFIETYPTIQQLAKASQDEVYSLWKGLGYYSRARNLHHTAKTIVDKHNGQFPENYEAILALKGIGPYTAAAIASFAFDLPYPVMDGNVKRVIARYYGYTKDVMAAANKKELQLLLDQSFNKKQPALFNQAIMDFGATVCKPKSPNCQACPFSKTCLAFQQNEVKSIPLRISKIKRRDRYFHYLVIKDDKHILFKKRQDKDIWQHLYDFPSIEHDENKQLSLKVLKGFVKEYTHVSAKKADILVKGPKSQILSHQRIIARFYTIYQSDLKSIAKENDLDLVQLKNSSSFAVPKIIDWYLKDNSISLFS